MTRRALHIAALLLLAAPVVAQTTVHAFVDQTTMGADEVLTYTVQITGDFRDIGQVVPPETRGLTAVQTNPVQHWDVTARGGVMRQQLALQWQYRPLGTGTAYIGETTLRLDGREVTTDPIAVTVVSRAQRAGPAWNSGGAPRPDVPSGAPDLFIRAEPSATAAFVGEQVTVEYVLYFETGVHPRNSRIVTAWDADGFWREDLEIDRFTGSQTVVLDGRRFEAIPIKRVALFPTRAGRLTVDSLGIEVDVLRAARTGPSRSPLYLPFSSRFDRETINAPAVTIEVSALPPGAPPSFSGAVGSFELAVRPPQREAEVGEAVRVAATVAGRGNIATLEAPSWSAPAQFEQYPVRESRRIDRHAEHLRGEKTFTYTLVPRSGGASVLPPVAWSYFDPDAEEYRTLRSDSLRLRVIGPAAPLAEAAPDADALLGPRAEAAWRPRRSPAPFYAVPWVWAGLALPALALLALVLTRRRGPDADSAYVRSLRAFPAAERGLKEADALRGAGRTRAFYTALEHTLRTFLADRLATPTRGLARPELDALLARRSVSAPTRAAVLALLRESDAATYAPHPGTPPPDTTARAGRLMAAVDAEADSPEVPA